MRIIWKLVWKKLTRRRPRARPENLRPGGGPNPEALADRALPAPVSPAVKANIRLLREAMGLSDDLVVREFRLGNMPLALAFIEELADKQIVERDILRAILENTVQRQGLGLPLETALAALRDRTLSIGETKEASTMGAVVNSLLEGNTAIFGQGWPAAICACTKGWEKRAIAEPDTEMVVRGPRDGFTETLRTNTSLIRRRLKSPYLQIESMEIGRLTRTQIALVYLRNLAQPQVVDEVRRRLRQIDLDGVLESGYLEEFLEERPFSPFPQIGNTERPDTVVGNLLEGRVAVFTDGTPFTLILPVTLNYFMQVPEDYYHRWPVVIGVRFFRYLGAFIAVFLPSLYVAFTTFHQELIPTPLAVAIAGQREQVPYPAFVEALFMQIIFEIMIEAGLRLPRAIGQAISIVGTLVIGEAAVRAGMASAAMVIVIAATALASFAIPSYALSLAARMLRLPMIFLAGSLGIFGIFAGLLASLIHLVSLRSAGAPYLAPAAPFFPIELKDVIVRVPWWAMLTRSPVAKNRRRVRPGARPPLDRLESEATLDVKGHAKRPRQRR